MGASLASIVTSMREPPIIKVEVMSAAPTGEVVAEFAADFVA
jgi:hypothetical protein